MSSIRNMVYFLKVCLVCAARSTRTHTASVRFVVLALASCRCAAPHFLPLCCRCATSHLTGLCGLLDALPPCIAPTLANVVHIVSGLAAAPRCVGRAASVNRSPAELLVSRAPCTSLCPLASRLRSLLSPHTPPRLHHRQAAATACQVTAVSSSPSPYYSSPPCFFFSVPSTRCTSSCGAMRTRLVSG